MDFYYYMREKGSSENHIMNNLKVIIEYVNYLDDSKLYDVIKREDIITFLNIKIKGGDSAIISRVTDAVNPITINSTIRYKKTGN